MLHDHNTWRWSVHMGACMISFAWISNHHYYMHVMEIIWVIPLFLNSFAKQISWLTSCLAFRKPFWAKLDSSDIKLDQDRNFYPYPWKKGQKDLPKRSFFCPRVINVLQKKRKEKRNENQPIKDWRKAKEKLKKKERKIQKGSLD